MVKNIVHDPIFLAQKSEPATEADAGVIKDLVDTLKANEAECVGMAANMIGVKKSIIAINVGIGQLVMINPKIVSKNKPFMTTEGCLSLAGEPKETKRYFEIEVEYLDREFKPQKQKYSGWSAQIIQHEIDHCNGVLI
ncbi:MAG: peptide deformylase [Lachnospiraceae bacterium]|jgi:peptide deformylase|nr:peptide deformylase [Lachnospiraceae bacterium]